MGHLFIGVEEVGLLDQVAGQQVQRVVTDEPTPYLDENGRLGVERLLATFVSFYAAHAPELVDGLAYSKIAPELVFLGYLQHMIDGHGTVDLKFGAARRRIDVVVALTNAETGLHEQREVFVLLARKKNDSGVKKRGIEWLEKALEQHSSDSGTLVVFDKRGKRSPGKRIKLKELVTEGGKTVRWLRV